MALLGGGGGGLSHPSFRFKSSVFSNNATDTFLLFHKVSSFSLLFFLFEDTAKEPESQGKISKDPAGQEWTWPFI